MSAFPFSYRRVTQFYETDAMGIIHHANYLLYFEEARLEFLKQVMEAEEGENILSELNYPLISSQVDYKIPLKFNQELKIDYKVTTQGARLIFDYVIFTKSFNKEAAFGKTIHVAFDMKKQQACRLPQSLIDFLSKERK